MLRHPTTRSSFMCYCPYHETQKPHCSVDLEQGLYHCFSCNAGGTLRSLFREFKGCSINKELGIPWEGKSADDEEFISPWQLQKDKINYDALPEVHIALTGSFVPAEISGIAKRYLAGRKIPLNVAQAMKMQFATMAHSYNTDDPRDQKQWVYFTERLCIPIYEEGKLLSCEGRDVYGEKAFNLKMKQLGKEDAVYKKCIYPKGASTSTLYQYDKLDKNKTIYFAEGLMDLAVLRSDPYFNQTNSTTIFGATISARQYYLLQKFDSFCYVIDNDLAGWMSLKRSVDELSKNQFAYKKDWRFVIPPFHDEFGVKDAGDIPVKANRTIQQCREAHWLDASKRILDCREMIDERVAALQQEKLKNENRIKV